MRSAVTERQSCGGEREAWAEHAQVLRYCVLGPVRVRRGAVAVPLGRPQEQALLCALLLRGGRTVTAQELVDAIWEGEPPTRVIASLRTHAFRLRKVLGPGVVISRAGGYALGPATGALDTQVCEALAWQAWQAREAGDLPRAREVFRSALRLWEGEPLAGVPGPYARIQRARLTEWRHVLHESCLEVELELGLHAQAVGELMALSAEQPLREGVRALLMLVLYRSGRRAEALQVYDATRRLLADELGIDPCHQLITLHQRILHGDPELELPDHRGVVQSGPSRSM